jgi:hypothetical protein
MLKPIPSERRYLQHVAGDAAILRQRGLEVKPICRQVPDRPGIRSKRRSGLRRVETQGSRRSKDCAWHWKRLAQRLSRRTTAAWARSPAAARLKDFELLLSDAAQEAPLGELVDIMDVGFACANLARPAREADYRRRLSGTPLAPGFGAAFDGSRAGL